MPTESSADIPPIAGLLRNEPGAPFAEPWQVHAFAIAVLASRQGCFTWSEWTHALGRELQRAADADSPAAGAGYFDCWLAALQSLLIGGGAIGRAELHDRRHEWEDAYRRTPHGMPVRLSAN